MQPIIEACVENYPESLIALKNGATRLELCENLSVAGTTPSYGAIKMCATKINIPTLVMIRPRGGNFIYDENEMEVMLEDISMCAKLKVAGVVFGCLNTDGKTINYNQMEKLIKAAGDLEIVLHRAYDELENPWNEVAKLKSAGVHKILSAGGKGTLFEGKENLLKTLSACNQVGMQLTAAGKITKENLEQAKKEVPAHSFHGRLIVGSFA